MATMVNMEVMVNTEAMEITEVMEITVIMAAARNNDVHGYRMYWLCKENL